MDPYVMAPNKIIDTTSGEQASTTDKKIWKHKVSEYVKRLRAMCENIKMEI